MNNKQKPLVDSDTEQPLSPLLTVDSVLFTADESLLKILLVKRSRSPFNSQWSLPGGFIDTSKDQSTRDTAIRKISEKTSVVPLYLEQLQTFSAVDRDPRGWSATVAYFSLIAYQETHAHLELVENTRWVNYQVLKQQGSEYQLLAFDHQIIIDVAINRLHQKALYSMLPVYCLNKEFTLSEYHQLMELILGRTVQKKSLYRRFEASDMFEASGKTVATGARAAMLYRLKEDVELSNFERNLGQ